MSSSHIAQKILDYHQSLSPDWKLPKGVELLFPFDQPTTWETMERFYRKYFSDNNSRILIFGINPGRFGAGITGTPFTDPIRLGDVCGIDSPFKKRSELSSIFVYDFIEAYGGSDKFYEQFYITSLCPLGLVKDGKNYNYYDSKELESAVEPYIIENIETQLELGFKKQVALCLGQGKNFKYFKRLNDKHQFFDTILPLPHPRWVMQYRLKRKQEFIDFFMEQFDEAIQLAQAK